MINSNSNYLIKQLLKSSNYNLIWIKKLKLKHVAVAIKNSQELMNILRYVV